MYYIYNYSIFLPPQKFHLILEKLRLHLIPTFFCLSRQTTFKSKSVNLTKYLIKIFFRSPKSKMPSDQQSAYETKGLEFWSSEVTCHQFRITKYLFILLLLLQFIVLINNAASVFSNWRKNRLTYHRCVEVQHIPRLGLLSDGLKRPKLTWNKSKKQHCL